MTLRSFKKDYCKNLLKWPFLKTSLNDFCVDTLFLNEHAQLKNKTKLKK